jgi:hypothetical protein
VKIEPLQSEHHFLMKGNSEISIQENMKRFKSVIFIILILLLSMGIFYRFQNMNWSQGANLHPDEYGLTNTLTQLQIPNSLADYFNTRISSISPYIRYGLDGNKIADGPDNRLRWGQWPIIMIRGLGELTGNTGYDEIRLMGRYFSATLDTLSVILILWIGWQLYGGWVGLAGAMLSALTVMQIQQSHFMTVDNFSTIFAVLAMICAVQVAKRPCLVRLIREDGHPLSYQPSWSGIGCVILFGISFGMAVASKINLLPLGGMILIAVFISIADLKLRDRRDLSRIAIFSALLLLIAGLVSVMTFRITQPMSFRAVQGDTTFFTLQLNPDWIESIKVAQMESNGIGGGPPSEQWAGRMLVEYPLMNMVVWGMGIPLGVSAWVGFLVALWQMLRKGQNWRSHLLLIVWIGGYFMVMGTRSVSSVRYFLPIYPFLSLMAGWLLVEMLRPLSQAFTRHSHSISRAAWKTITATILALVLVCGTFAWATVFTQTIYGQDHTRIQASKWIYQNIPAPFQIGLQTQGEIPFIPINAPDQLQISQSNAFTQAFSPENDGKLTTLKIPHLQSSGPGPVELKLTISSDVGGTQIIDETIIRVDASPLDSRGIEVQGEFHGTQVKQGQEYFLKVIPASGNVLVTVYRNIVANEDWDEGLPVRFYGFDPFGQFYNGITMNVRWSDDEHKRQMYIQNLEMVDYIILPSQRSIWSISRFPLKYPMTMEYYQALFDGRLGFDERAAFQSPFRFGPLWISDSGGLIAWNKPPGLPLFNFNFLAAEEAFSVYDHPPVWIFKKSDAFNIENVQKILSQFDLNNVMVQ